MFEIVVDKRFLSNKIKNVLKSKPILLPFWSAFGSLLKWYDNKFKYNLNYISII